MIHWLRLSVKTDNLQVRHLYPIHPSAADRIYIKCTYQTPLSHLWMHWWSPNLPKPASSSLTASPHHMFLLPLIEMREQMRRRCKKNHPCRHHSHTETFFYIYNLPFFGVFHQTYFCTWNPSSCVASLHVRARPLSLHVQHRLRDFSPFPCPRCLFFPSSFLPRQ